MPKGKQVEPDKNLINTVEALSVKPVNSHQAQQLDQDRRDRRRQMLKHS